MFRARAGLIVALAVISFGVEADRTNAAPADAVIARAAEEKEPGNAATASVRIAEPAYRAALLIDINVYATATYTPPNPTWFVVTLKVNGKVVAANDVYRDGNFGSTTSKFNNAVSFTIPAPANEFTGIQATAVAHGPGAAEVKNTTVRLHAIATGIR